MNPNIRLFIVISFTVLVAITVTTIVSDIVRRSSAVATRQATQSGVLFIVCMRRWASMLVRSVGIAITVIGALLFLVSLTSSHTDSTLGMGIAGVIMALGGLLFVWLAHGMTRLRLEVTPDSVWSYPMMGAPKKISLGDINALTPLKSNNYGGVVARSNSKSLFYASRVMLGYPQLIDYFRTMRPDLAIPDASLPL